MREKVTETSVIFLSLTLSYLNYCYYIRLCISGCMSITVTYSEIIDIYLCLRHTCEKVEEDYYDESEAEIHTDDHLVCITPINS